DLRRELILAGAVHGRAGDLGAGLYSQENVSAVYDEVLRRAHTWLRAGHSVIVDGTWRDGRNRQRAYTVAAESYSPVVELMCTLPIGEASQRILNRGASSSDATPSIAAELSAWAAEWPSAHRLDTARPIADSVAEAQRLCLLAV
ncbi:MAG: AAA family ATPase, partial [Actinomycetota bacterium]|nr:AAA family ATPase [Actinomycetota bacterium]